MNKIVLAGLLALGFAVSSGLFAVANAAEGSGGTAAYAQSIGNGG